MVKTFVKVHFTNFFNLFLFYSLNLLAVLMFFFFFLSLFLRRLYDDLGLSFFCLPIILCTSLPVTCVSRSLLLVTKVRNKEPEEKAGVIQYFSDSGLHSVFAINSF